MRAFAEAWPDGEFVQAALAQLPWYHPKYQLVQALPKELQTDLPRIADIESELRGADDVRGEAQA